MEVALALLVGLLGGISAWLLLSGHLLRALFGIALLSNAANLAIFAVGRLSYAAPAVVASGAVAPAGTVGNALPQALILTAIVISFGLFAVMLAVIYRAHRRFGTLDGDTVSAAAEQATEPQP
jgi:multicomponent Na+:H+ antiporter subunit C